MNCQKPTLLPHFKNESVLEADWHEFKNSYASGLTIYQRGREEKALTELKAEKYDERYQLQFIENTDSKLRIILYFVNNHLPLMN